MKNLCTFILFMMAYIVTAQKIVVSEIMYNPPESGEDTLEYFEITNLTANEFKLEGCIVTKGVQDTFEAMDVIAPFGHFVCVKKSSAFSAIFPNIDARQWKSGALSNSGETIEISDAQGNVLTSVTYGNSKNGWPPAADAGGASQELCDLSKDPAIPANWGASKTGTGRIVNGKEVFGTPGAANNTECGVVINPNTVIVKNFSFSPSELTIKEGETVTWNFEEGHHNVNGKQSAFPDNPDSFFSGPAADAPFTYSFTFTKVGDYSYQCDPHATSMKGKIHVLPKTPSVSYPVRTIGEISQVDGQGVADSLGRLCEVKGIVYGVNMRATGISTTIIDSKRDGIGLFSNSKTFGYTVNEGDEVTVRGKVDQFNGLTQIQIDTMWVNSSGNTIFTPRTTTVLGEEEESDLVMLTGMSLKDPGQWKKGSTFNATITNGTNEFTLRVVNTTTLSQIDAPSGSFTVVGIGGQFDSSNPYTDGYQLLPRKSEDLVPTVSTRNLIGDQVSVFPNPSQDQLFVSSSLNILKLEVLSETGKWISTESTNSRFVDIHNLLPGNYLLRITTAEGIGVKKFIKL
ncbi:MAG: T9SS type A sorting domain-containing protein [Saprospiraceae bacterium]|nr:MAG: endonuclease i [Candidatus Parvibacillus calidus]MCC7150124.1 T9SS type A sorting domain-containing protein [Saprospiraceae bacterium]